MVGGGDVQRGMTEQWRALLAMERCAMSNGECKKLKEASRVFKREI